MENIWQYWPEKPRKCCAKINLCLRGGRPLPEEAEAVAEGARRKRRAKDASRVEASGCLKEARSETTPPPPLPLAPGRKETGARSRLPGGKSHSAPRPDKVIIVLAENFKTCIGYYAFRILKFWVHFCLIVWAFAFRVLGLLG